MTTTPATNSPPRVTAQKLILSPDDPTVGVAIPVLTSVGVLEADVGGLAVFTFDNNFQGDHLADSQLRQTRAVPIYNTPSVDPNSGEASDGDPTATPLMVERVDQFVVYDANSVGGQRLPYEPNNVQYDGDFTGGGQVDCYGIDNVDGEGTQFQAADFSKAGGVGSHLVCHTVRIYGGSIQLDTNGNPLQDGSGNYLLDLSPDVWLDIQYIDQLDVIDDHGQERVFTLLFNPTQDQYPLPG